MLYLTAEEAAERLRVSVTTVYAYVSRKQLRAQRADGAGRSLYWRADVERIARKGQPSPTLLAQALVESTELTLLTEGGHFYRGRSAIALADHATLEDVAGLLWNVDPGEDFAAEAPALPAAYGAIVGERPQATPLQLAILALSLMELETPRAFDLSPDGYVRSGVAIVRAVGAILLGAGQPSAEPLHEFIVRRTEAPRRLADLVRRLLVLAADHELDPTAYAVRAAANTGVTPYAAMIAGLVSSSGRRLTFGRADQLARFFEEVMASSDPRDVVLGRARDGEAVPGFQSKNYPHGDPRARAMLAALRDELGDDPELKMLDRLVAAVFETSGAHPDFVLLSAFLSRKIGLDRRHGSLVRVARVAGWIAHALEQYHGRDLVRPHAPYAGRLPPGPMAADA